MSLASGTKLGPYEVLGPLGAGGMGEVYKAKDTRLERVVALKVLPEDFFEDEESIARFEREARMLASLNHPGIAHLYSFEEIPGSAGSPERHLLSMELADGETLAERLLKGPLSLDQVLKTSVEIASALDAAHRAGIVHRDVKPGNVMLTKSGAKLLDFGLAKVAAPLVPQSDLTSRPTELPKNLTQKGTILGTVQYMAPEQLEGKEADARSDIFAFGAVLYEMATGKKAFSGASQASLISAILRDDPKPVSSVQPMTPPALDRVVQSCLAKDPEERWQSAGDLRKELHWIAQGGAAAQAPVSQRAGKKRERLAWAAAAIVGAGLAAALLLRSRTPPVAFDRAIQFKVSLPESVVSSELDPVKTLFALSPDGSALAFLGSTAATRQIYVRSLDADVSRAVPGTQGAQSPFWSPDGKNLAFFSDGKLKRVDLSGGPVITICDAQNGAAGTWSPNGAILFSTWGAGSPVLHEVAASGGAPTDATKLDSARREHWQTWPMFLPDGKHFLYVSEAGDPWPNDQRQIWLGDLGSKTVRFVAPTESRFGYSPTGHLLFTREGALFAQAFDPDRALFRGEPFPVAPEILTYAPTSAAGFAVAEHAPVLAFKERPATRLTWVARSGKELGAVRPDAPYTSPRFSPAGDRLAFAQLDPRLGTYDIWIEDLSRATTARATFEPVSEAAPVWFPDGRRIVYCADVGGNVPDLFWLDPADGKNGLLLHTDGVKYPQDISPDGRFLLYTEIVSKQAVIWVLPLTGQKKPFRFLTDPFSEYAPRFSPDGRFVAYVATESGKPEVYVRPFPGPGTAWQVSRSGGKAPRWSRDGREIFFLSEHALMSASVRTNRGFESAAPASLFAADLFEGGDSFDYEIAPDGRFLVLSPVAGPRDSGLHVIANWLSGFKK